MSTLKNLQSQMLATTPGSDEFSRIVKQLDGMSSGGDIDSALYLSWVYSQQGAIKNFSQKSFDLCQNIVQKTGHPLALERMADLMLWGVGIEQNRAQSFKIYENLALNGMLPLTTLAYLYSQGVGIKANEVKASTQIILSAAQGETLAFMLLSYRYKIGLGVSKNGLLSCAYAELACLRNFPGSIQNKQNLIQEFASINQTEVITMSKKLIANIESLADKVDELSKSISPQSQEFAQAYIKVVGENINALDLTDLSVNENRRGFVVELPINNKLNLEILSNSPKLMKVDDFVSFEECQYLIAQAQPMLESTQTQLQRNIGLEVDAFSGESAILANRQTSPMNRVIQQRFADLTNTPVENFEPISVLKYSIGHEYSLHTDAFDAPRIKEHEKKGDFGGQRMTTNLIYLLPATQGGHTHYQAIDCLITGKVGTAIIHYNATKDYKPDPRSKHAGQIIMQGEKWLLRTASRHKPLYGTNKI